MVELEKDDSLNNTLVLFAESSIIDIITLIGQKATFEHTPSLETRRNLEKLAESYRNHAKELLESNRVTVDASSFAMLMGMLQSYEKYLQALIKQNIEKESNEEKLKKIPDVMKRVSNAIKN